MTGSGPDTVIDLGSRQEYRLSGAGGQGLQLAAVVLADAATAAGREVVQTQSYGPEARGGASRSEVIVADSQIDFPEFASPDVTLCLSQAAFETFAAATRRGGLVVYDSGLVEATQPHGIETFGAPFTTIAKEEAGTKMAANIVSLAALTRLTGVLGREELLDAVRRRMPERLVEANLRAFAAGWEVASTEAGPAAKATGS